MDLLTRMQTFVSIVEGKSLSAAARTQGLSLPAVSRQLSALEAELGGVLIVRSTRSLHVTEAGQAFYGHAVSVLRELELARAAVAPGSGAVGRLVVSASLTFGQLQIVPRLAEFARHHPHLQLDLRLEDQLVDLVGEGVDIAVRAGTAPPNSTAYMAQRLLETRRVLVAAPAYLRKHGTLRALEQLRVRSCLVQVTLSGQVIRWVLQYTGREPQVRKGDRPRTGQAEVNPAEPRAVDVRPAMRCNAPLALCDLALSGAGIAYLPEFVVAQALASGRLKRVLGEWSSPPLFVSALYRAELRQAPRVRAFLDMFAPAVRDALP